MNYQRIEKIENEFRQLQGNGVQLKPFHLQHPLSNEVLDIIACRPNHNNGNYFYNSREPKEKIVIHHTAGHLQGDLNALTRDEKHISTAFVIARDGTIYQLFNSSKWSYHLGKGAIGGNATQSQSSIGIELSNYGYLVQRGTKLETVYSRTKKRNGVEIIDVYCDLLDLHLYKKLESPFRKQFYYATFTEEQYKSLSQLIRFLSQTYNIPIKFVEKEDRFQTTQKAAKFNGILSHVNFKATGKWDVGPVFDFDLLEEYLTTPAVATPNGQEMEELQKSYKIAEKLFQQQQVKLWETHSENPSEIGELTRLEKVLNEAGQQLEAAQNGAVLVASTKEIVTEDEIDEQMPLNYSTARSIFFDEDGPEETPYDYLADL